MADNKPNFMKESEGTYGPLHGQLVGDSTHIRELDSLITRLADTKLTVLISGETGTGKDIVARLLHRRSSRRNKPFVKVNCPSLPNELLESELFGYEKGAFTGAHTSKPGRFELADKGTIFLDEITEVSESSQLKLMQVLDGEPFMRIGGVKPVQTDIRVVTATNIPVQRAVEMGKLREDVCFRLSEYVIHTTPLRDRPEDIPSLVEHFNYNYSANLGRDYQPIGPEILTTMQQQQWLGNVRALAAKVKEYVATGNASVLTTERAARAKVAPDALQADPGGNGKSSTHPAAPDTAERTFTSLKEAARKAVEETERALIEEALRYTLWNRRKAAKLLGTSYSSLLRRIETYEIGRY